MAIKGFKKRKILSKYEIVRLSLFLNKIANDYSKFDRYGGRYVDLFEKDFSRLLNVNYAAAVSSGTAAIHSAIAACNFEPGHEIITTCITDAGTVSPIVAQNLIPVFADVDYETLNISPADIVKKISAQTRAIIAVHLAGQPCNMAAIMKIAQDNQLIVIEDCSQAMGSLYQNRLVGTIGDMGTFSFMAGKHITTLGQGGMVVTNNEELYWKAKRFADRGKPFHSHQKTNLVPGMNYRMTEIQAFSGRLQLKKIHKIRKKRNHLIKTLRRRMSKLKLIKLWKTIPDVLSNYWCCIFILHLDQFKNQTQIRQSIIDQLHKEKIPVLSQSNFDSLIYDQLWIKNKSAYGESKIPWNLNQKERDDSFFSCPNGEKIIKNHLVLHINEDWRSYEIDKIINGLEKIDHLIPGQFQ